MREQTIRKTFDQLHNFKDEEIEDKIPYIHTADLWPGRREELLIAVFFLGLPVDIVPLISS